MKPNKDIFVNHHPESFAIEIFRLEDMDESLFSGYQRHDFHQVIWVTKSGGDHSCFIDFNELTIKDNHIAVIFPGQMYKIDIQGKEGFLFALHNDIFFHINQQISSDYLNGYFSNIFISLDNGAKDILERPTDLILQEYNSFARVILLESYMLSFLFHTSSFLEKGTARITNKKEFIFAHLIQLIDKHFIDQREVAFYAVLFHPFAPFVRKPRDLAGCTVR